MDIKVFIIHYKKLINRKEEMIKQFKQYNIINYEFIEIDRDEVEDYDLSIFDENFLNNEKKIKVVLAVLLSHIYAYKECAEKYDNILILEDDSKFKEKFLDLFKIYLTQLPKDYDMLFIGEGCNLHIQQQYIIPGKYIYEKGVEATRWGGDGATRCLSSYLVSKKCSKEICNYIEESKKNKYKKIDNWSDYWLNRVCREKKFKVYWSEPTLVLQGSQDGSYDSSY